tara:strand:- start:3437 stop:4384 length:948 start_codon:yes stop_codon:yes gene_type:complete
MKKAIISYSTSNVGDEIQSLAVKQIIDKVDYYIDREKLNEFRNNEPVKLIINGWYMANPDNWPPSEDIIPLFISFHISHNANTNKIFLSEKNITYFKKYEPIGCRDKQTKELLESHGVKAYFSGCATLTYKNKFKERNNKILCVDPLFNIFPYSYGKNIYKNLIPSSLHKDVEYIEHKRYDLNKSNAQRFHDAEELIAKFSQAKVVITSRIHAALPCLALGTPVIFLDVGYTSKNQRNRFNGLTDKMLVINDSSFPFSNYYNPLHIIARVLGLYKFVSKPRALNIDWSNPPKNNTEDTSLLAEGIRKKINDFLND